MMLRTQEGGTARRLHAEAALTGLRGRVWAARVPRSAPTGQLGGRRMPALAKAVAVPLTHTALPGARCRIYSTASCQPRCQPR